MKTTISIFLLALCLTHVSASPTLSTLEYNAFKKNAEDLVSEYYANGLNLLTGEDLAELKIIMIEEIISLNFRNDKVKVFNDIQNLTDPLTIREYLLRVNSLLGNEKDGAEFSAAEINIPNIYVSGDSFFIKVEVSRALTFRDEKKNTTAKVDYYLSFNPAKKKELKIYGMGEHKDNASQFKPVTIEEKSYLNTLSKSNTQSSSKPAFIIFNITPPNSLVKINGDTTYYINGGKVRVNAGYSNIEVFAKGYETQTFNNFQVNEGSNSIEVELLPKMGSVTLLPNGKNAKAGTQVFIDGIHIGTLPITRYGLQEGPHKIQVKKEGCIPKKKTIIIGHQTDATLEIQLTSDEAWKTPARIGVGVLKSLGF